MNPESIDRVTRDRAGGTAKPAPVRYWWAKRVGVGLAVLLMGRLGLGWATNWKLNAEFEKLKAAGDPVRVEDLVDDPIPDEENAAKLYIAAAEALGEDKLVDRGLFDLLLNEPTEEDVSRARQEFKTYSHALQLVREGRMLSGFDWGTELKSPMETIRLPHLQGVRTVCNALLGSAIYHHFMDRDGEAFRSLMDIMQLARGVESEGFWVNCAVSIWLQEQAASLIEEIGPSLSVSEELDAKSAGTVQGRSVSRESIESLIGDFLDDEPMQRALARVFQTERVMHIDLYQSVLDGRVGWVYLISYGKSFDDQKPIPVIEPTFNWMIKPLLTIDLIKTLAEDDRYLDAAGTKHSPEADALFVYIPPADKKFDLLSRASSINYPARDPSRIFTLHFSHLAARRRAAVALAGRLYEVDHGRRPRKVEDLVPGYLGAVPLDPMVDDGSVIGLPETWEAEGEATTREALGTEEN